jgi:hypothetical protein
MKRSDGVGLTSDSSIRDVAKKEWRQPTLRKLPIAATANSSKGAGTMDDGISGKGGSGDVARPS